MLAALRTFRSNGSAMLVSRCSVRNNFASGRPGFSQRTRSRLVRWCWQKGMSCVKASPPCPQFQTASLAHTSIKERSCISKRGACPARQASSERAIRGLLV